MPDPRPGPKEVPEWETVGRSAGGHAASPLAARSASGRGPGRAGLLGAVLLLGLPLGTAAQAPGDAPPISGADLPVVEDTLENGMRILALPRPGSPTVSFVVRYRVGSVNEHLGNTGIAHLLEHLLFKGTSSVGTRNVEAERELFGEMDALQDSILRERGRLPDPDTARIRLWTDSIRALEDSARTFVVSNEFDEILTRNGARSLNATTGEEATTYFVQLPANRAKLWFILEGERMSDPVFREFYAERDVVAEERRSRVDTNPAGRIFEAHMASAFRVHPYGVPVIGHMSDIQRLTRPQVRSYYERFYGARNAVVAVVGAIDPDSVRSWARRYLGRVPPGDEPPPVLVREPEQRGERRTEVLFDAEPHLKVGWRAVDVFHRDRPALLVLSSLLTGGRSSRLHRRLVQEERLATFVSSSLGPGDLYPGLLTIDAFPRAPHGPDDLEAAIYEEVARLKEEPPEPVEIERVRNALRASRVRRMRSNFGLAQQIASSASLFGDWRTTFRYTDRLVGVTREDVRRVARRYLRRDARTVTILRPPAEEKGEEVTGEEGAR